MRAHTVHADICALRPKLGLEYLADVSKVDQRAKVHEAEETRDEHEMLGHGGDYRGV